MSIGNTKIIFLRSNNINHSGVFGMTINNILNNECSEDLRNLVCCDYQRPYTWKGNEINDLIEDIEKCGDNNFHFIGILYFGVVHTNHGKPIIDGQQRIITIFLILYHLRISNNFLIKVKIDKDYYSLNEILEDKKCEESLLLNEYKKSMKKALEEISNYFDNKERSFKEEFKIKLLNKLYFLSIVCEDEKMEESIFMDINSKGIKLDDIDKIKAFLLSKVYKNNLSNFIKQWSILNKNGKKSINLFLKILMNAVDSNNKRNSSGKVKYEKFVKIYEKYENEKKIDAFKNEFDQAIERFKIIPYDDKEIFNSNDSTFDRNKRNLHASIYLARRLDVYTTFIQELTHKDRFNNYINGVYSPIILFLLYILTYICELDFSFGNADSRKKIDDFQRLNEQERKEQVWKLWLKCKKSSDDGKCLLDKIVSKKIKGDNDQISKITEKNKCIFPLLTISLFEYIDFYEYVDKNRNKEEDHIVAKCLLLNKEPKFDKNMRKSLEYKFNYIGDDEEIKGLMRSIYNIQLISHINNKSKSNFLDKEFCIMDSHNKIIGIDYKKIKLFLCDKRKKLIDKLDDVIYKLTK